MTIYLVTGGAKSGKTAYSLSLANRYEKKCYLATAEARDDEMRDRIAKHKKERGDEWETIEEPFHVNKIIREKGSEFDVILLDCITLWISNLILEFDEERISEEVQAFEEVLQSCSCSLVIVTNELGSGIVPENDLARKYRDIIGSVNQKIAKIADKVTLVVSGIPMLMKGDV